VFPRRQLSIGHGNRPETGRLFFFFSGNNLGSKADATTLLVKRHHLLSSLRRDSAVAGATPVWHRPTMRRYPTPTDAAQVITGCQPPRQAGTRLATHYHQMTHGWTSTGYREGQTPRGWF